MTCARCGCQSVFVSGITCAMWVCLSCGSIATTQQNAAMEVSGGKANENSGKYGRTLWR